MAADRQEIGTFTVHVIQGRDLAAKDKRGTSDPYVVVKVDGSEFRTAVIKKNLCPSWNEMFSTPVYSDGAVFHLEVWDKDKIGSDDFMGEAKLSLSACPEFGKYRRMWLHLVPRKMEHVSGDVEVMVKFVPTEPGAASSSSKTASASSRRRRRRKAAVHYSFDPPAWLGNVPQIVDPLDEMFIDEPVASRFVSDALFSDFLEDPRDERNWYNRFFKQNPHDVFVGRSDDLKGSVAVAVLATRSDSGARQYWTIVFSQASVVQAVVEDADPGASTLNLAGLLARVGDGALAKYAKSFVRVSHEAKVVRDLGRIEDPEPDDKIKIGVLFARHGQTDDDAMFSNIDGSPAFEEFLDFLGDRVRLKGFSGYSAQLDTSNDGSGLYSVYVPDYKGYKVMYHVSTLLQYDETDPQRVQRKRFIGNDIVVIVFMDGTTPYAVNTMASQYTRVLVVVQPDPDNDARYRVSTAYAKDVRDFGPDSVAYVDKGPGLRSFLLAKCINGELATKASPEFVVREKRTRKQYLDMLYDDFAPKGKKDASLSGEAGANAAASGGATGSTMLAELPAAEPQALTFTPLLANVPGKVCTFEEVGGSLFMGTEDGVYRAELGSPDCTRVLDVSGVVQLEADTENNYLFVLTANPERMLAFTLDALLNGSKPSTSMIPAHNPMLFASGRVADNAYITIALDEAIDVYRVESTPGSFTKMETLHLPAKVNSITAVARGIVVGASSDESASFTFFAYPDFAPTVLHTADPKDTCVAAFTRPTGIILCYDSFGVFLDRSGVLMPQSIFVWKAQPVSFAVLGPFLIVQYREFASVLSTKSGAIVESHWVPSTHPFNNAADSEGVFAAQHDAADNATNVLHLVPIADPPSQQDLAALAAEDGGYEAYGSVLASARHSAQAAHVTALSASKTTVDIPATPNASE